MVTTRKGKASPKMPPKKMADKGKGAGPKSTSSMVHKKAVSRKAAAPGKISK